MSAITRRCDYAMRIMRQAYKNSGSYISIADVAETESIPYSFARSIQHELVKAGYLKTNRGVHGGLILDCDPKTTTIYDVLSSLEDSISVADCTVEGFACPNKEGCEFNAVWHAADALLQNLYGSITLADLFEQGAKHPAIVAARKLPPLGK